MVSQGIWAGNGNVKKITSGSVAWAASLMVILGSGGVWAQSSSPFSGLGKLFAKGEAERPVDLIIRVEGGDDGLERAIRNTSLINAALDDNRFTGQDILAAARADYARVLGALYDQGRYDAVINIRLDGVEAAQIAPLDAPDSVSHAVIEVQPGRKFSFSRAEIGPLSPRTDLPKGYAVGKTAGTGTIKSAAAEGVRAWRQDGHAKADVVVNDITAHHPSATVDSRIGLNPGPVVTFGTLNMQGYQRMTPRRLAKIAGFPKGQRFDPDALDTMRKRLRRSGVFSAITLTEAEVLNPDNSMDVDLAVVEQKKRRAGAGFELSNTDGAMVSAYWMHRNLRGGGERLRFDVSVSDIGAKYSGRDASFKARLERPATFHPDITAYLEAEIARQREEDYEADIAALSFGGTYIHSDRLSADVALQYRFSRVTDDGGRTNYRVLALPSSVTWDKRDVPNDPTKGYWLSAEATPFYGFGDTGSGIRLLAEGRAYRGFGSENKLVLAGRARFGSIAGAAIADTPRDYLFYSGGGGSVRGQPYQSLGVEVIDGPDGKIKTGGMSIASATAELRYRLREKIGLAVFADVGRVWTETAFQGDSGWHAGAGAGLRYLTPIGPLRFDVAGPVGGGDTGNGIQVYLGLGQAF